MFIPQNDHMMLIPTAKSKIILLSHWKTQTLCFSASATHHCNL